MAQIPGVNTPGSKLRPTSGAVATGQVTNLPEIYEANPSDAVPSIAIVGASGVGKTRAIKLLLRSLRERGKTAIVVAVESKQQVLAEERPLILPIGAPVVENGTARPANVTDKYNRLMAFREALRSGAYRTHKGMQVAAVCFDGLMEIGDVIKGHRTKNMPTSSSTGEKNSFALFDQIGTDLIDFMATCREAASDASKAFGIEPLGIIATCGEELKNGEFRPILPGNMAPVRFPYQFEMVLRYAIEGEDYVAYSKGGQVYVPSEARWFAKAPGDLFETRIVNPDLGAIYTKLVNYYQGVATTPGGESVQ